MTQEELKEKAERMQAFLNERPSNDVNEILRRIEDLGILIAKSGQYLAEAKYLQDTVVNGAIFDAIQRAYEERLSASTINKFVTTAAKDCNYLVNWFDRINSAAVHQLDGLRTTISYRKAEMNLI